MYCISYVIKKGDTLYKLSRQFRIPLSSILDANPLVNVYDLKEGEAICIPVSVPQNNAQHFTTYLVQEGDTLQSIMDKYNINMADLMQLNNPDSIQLLPGSTLQVPIMGEGESGVTL